MSRTEMRYVREDPASVARAAAWREANGPADERRDAGGPGRSTPTLAQMLDLTPLDAAAARALDTEREAEEALRAAEARDRERAARAYAAETETAQRLGLRR
jgi:hypothetical protein